MCECLCGSVRGELNIRTSGSTDVVSIDVYPGCRECEQVIGIDVRVFSHAGIEEWLGNSQIHDVAGDEYGHIPTFKSIPIVSLEALQEASREFGDLDDYDTLADWLNDYGLEWLQYAMRLTRDRGGAGYRGS